MHRKRSHLQSYLVSCLLRKEVGQKEPKIIHRDRVGFLILFMNHVNLNHPGQNEHRVVLKRLFFLGSRYTGIAICTDFATGLRKKNQLP